MGSPAYMRNGNMTYGNHSNHVYNAMSAPAMAGNMAYYNNIVMVLCVLCVCVCLCVCLCVCARALKISDVLGFLHLSRLSCHPPLPVPFSRTLRPYVCAVRPWRY